MYTKTAVPKIALLAAVVFFGTIALASTAMATQKQFGKRMYLVTIKNITRGQPVAPSVIATHTKDFRLFELGGPTPATGDSGYDVYFGLATAAETGYPFTLFDAVSSSHGVDEALVLPVEGRTPPVLLPGESNSTTISASRFTKFLSAAAMLGKTNDGFYALRDVQLPVFIGETVYYYADGYDAGSEENDEIGIGGVDGDDGPSGTGINVNGEGYIHVHAGIHGIGNLEREIYDWRNPVVEVKIERTK